MSAIRDPQSAIRNPEVVTNHVIAGRPILLVRPAEPDRLLDDPAVQARNAVDDAMPYWAYLWPTAPLLAEAVASRAWPAGHRALEIGCGLGLVGLAGLAAGHRVHFTDHDPAPLDLVARSARLNGHDPSAWSTGLLDWHDPPADLAPFPLIVGSDVLYECRLVPLVVRLLDCLLAPGGLALLAGPYRVATEDLAPLLAAGGWRCDVEALSGRDDRGEPVRGSLYRIERPSRF